MSARMARKLAPLTRVATFAIVGVVAGSMMFQGCLVTEHCYSASDCDEPQICKQDGTCGFECETDQQCGESMGCVDHRCQPKSVQPIECPSDMVNIADAFCIDRFEASRPDATQDDEGVQVNQATSRGGVMPWQVSGANENQQARDACLAAGKDLCTPQQWQAACQGKAGTVYGYGDGYQPKTCNGIDTFGLPGFHLLPTGTLQGCHSDWGAYDMNGNLWEHTLGGNRTTIRGGAFNCKDSQTLHRCDYVPGSWEPSARGFRCCLVPSDRPDAGVPDVEVPDVDTDVLADVESGCLDDVGVPDVLDAPADAPADVPMDVSLDGQDASDAPEDADPDVNEGCPPDMVRVDDFCMDTYEASRADATAVSQGVLPFAASRKGVMPWFPVDLQTARDACEAMEKRLCTLDEWVEGCSGPSGTVYGYGNEYDPTICNGIDTYCDCGGAMCGGLSTCPYPHCFNQASPQGGGPCGAMFHVEPTGSFPECVSAHGAVDINGNVWELADTYDGLEHFRGGAFNCSDSEALHRCDHDGTWGPTARGFRCCKDPQ